jgi:acid phosphatase (class A)
MQKSSQIASQKRTTLAWLTGFAVAFAQPLSRASDWRDAWQATPLASPRHRLLNRLKLPPEVYLQQHLAPPPLSDSADHRQDIEALHQVQAARSAQELEVAIRLEPMSFWPWLVWCLRSRDIQPSDPLPPAALREALDVLRNDFEEVLLAARKRYPRPRPAVADPRLNAAWQTGSTNSYPSAKVWAFMLQVIALDAVAPGLIQQAQAGLEQLAKSREVALVHYPSDVIAARLAAASMGKELTQTMALEGYTAAEHRSALIRWLANLAG